MELRRPPDGQRRVVRLSVRSANFLPPYSLRSKNLFQHVVYTGTRNGSIQCFDKRLASGQKGQELFNGRFKNDNRSVTHLNILHETQMLVSTIRGDVSCLQDLAWTRVVS